MPRTARKPMIDPERMAELEKERKEAKEKSKVSGITGGVMAVPKDPPKEESPEDKNARGRIDKLNECADYILSCLEPDYKKDWQLAAKENKVPDLGIYLLGVLNRLSKMVDYMETDIEPGWETGKIVIDEKLYCQYCKKLIESPTNIKQIYCSNLCAKKYRDKYATGIVYPTGHSTVTEEQMEKQQWDREQRRINAGG